MRAKIHSYGRVVDSQERQHGEVWCFHCPGCGYDHPFHTGGDQSAHPQWSFNGDVNAPTFSPSLVVSRDDPKRRCHSFVRNGKIEFLSDSWHALKGQTVELPDWDEDDEKIRTDALRRNIGVKEA